jgi:hypothetical protein
VKPHLFEFSGETGPVGFELYAVDEDHAMERLSQLKRTAQYSGRKYAEFSIDRGWFIFGVAVVAFWLGALAF